MSDAIQFYRHQIKPEYHNGFNTGLEHDPTGQLLGTLWLTHKDAPEDDPVDADSLFDPLVSSELKQMLVPYAVVPLLEDVSFYVDYNRTWTVGVLSTDIWASDTDFDITVHCLLDNLRDRAYAEATEGAMQSAVERMYCTYFALEAYYDKNTVEGY